MNGSPPALGPGPKKNEDISLALSDDNSPFVAARDTGNSGFSLVVTTANILQTSSPADADANSASSDTTNLFQSSSQYAKPPSNDSPLLDFAHFVTSPGLPGGAYGQTKPVSKAGMKGSAALLAARRSNPLFTGEDPSFCNELFPDTTPIVKKVSKDTAEDDKVSSSCTLSHSPSSSAARQMLKEFPFMFDGYCGWTCRHCSHIEHYYRGLNYVWMNTQPPPSYFMDQHLMNCPGLHPAVASNNIDSIRQSSTQKMTGSTAASDGLQRGFSSSTTANPHDNDDLPTLPAIVTATKDQARWSHQWNKSQQESPSQMIPHGMSPREGVSKPTQHPHEMPNDKDSKVKVRKREPYKHTSPAGIPSSDATYTEALGILRVRADAIPRATQSTSDIGTTLVEAEDFKLLTDYFYYMMMQLVVCRFSDKDSKTRGGRRDNIALGFGGLECVHCSRNADYSRKFYWSTVDRLANSFAEIPTHVLKCKCCPEEVRKSLLVLKGRHASQMSSHPRGSQKVFFRRIWRRLHSGDNSTAAENTSSLSSVALKSPNLESGTAAKRLKAATTTPSPEKVERVVLALPQDKDWLSDMDCFVRANVEIFIADDNDLALARLDRKYPIKLGQVGLRCVHCARSVVARREAVIYPNCVSSIYESVRDFQQLHLNSCPTLPTDLQYVMSKLNHGSRSSLTSVLRRYYIQSARALGLFDSEDGGIRAGGIISPMNFSSLLSTTSELSQSQKQVDPSETDNAKQVSNKRLKIDRFEEV